MRLFQITIVPKSGMCVFNYNKSSIQIKKKLKKVLVVVKVAAV